MARMEALVEAGVDAIVIDTAHGHTKNVNQVLKAAKSKFKNIDIIVGNIATRITSYNVCYTKLLRDC